MTGAGEGPSGAGGPAGAGGPVEAGIEPAEADLQPAGNDLEVDELARRWSAAWTGGAGFAACCTAGVSYEDPLADRPLLGLDALERHAAALRTALPDAQVERTAPPLERGRHACIPWKLLGTHRGELATLPATDKSLVLHGLHYLELSDGRISRARGFFDLYDGAVQLGLLPARGGFGEAALMLLQGFGLRRQTG